MNIEYYYYVFSQIDSHFLAILLDTTVTMDEVPGRMLHSYHLSVPQDYSEKINIALAS